MHRTLYTSKTAVLFFLLLFITHFFSSSCLLPVQAEEQNQRIHYLTLPDNTEAILLECNGQFGMVDSGEDNDFPTGEDPRYPLRPGIVQGRGYEDDVIAYLNSVGVTQDNFEFYIGTHPHSDHIGSADEIIRAFHPKRVYIQEYKDTYITYPGNLWDNLYVYDHMLGAATEVGATVIQNFSLDAPLYPEKVLIRGTIEWNDCQNQDSLRPDHITVILSQSDLEVIQELTVSPDEDGNWLYEFEQLQKYDNTKTPIIYQVTLESIDGYKTEKADNGYDFLCSHAADEEEADASQRVTETDDNILSDDAKEINDTDDTVPSVDSKETTETDDIVLPDDSEEVGETDDTISSGNPEETAETDDTVSSDDPDETAKTDDTISSGNPEETAETDDTVSSGNPEETAGTDDTVPSDDPDETAETDDTVSSGNPEETAETDDTVSSGDPDETAETDDTVSSGNPEETAETDDTVSSGNPEETAETDDTVSSGDPEETAEIDDTVPSEEPTEPDGKYPEGGIFDDVSDSYDNSGSSDHLSTDHITFQDQVDATCLLDPNNEASLQTAEPAQTGLFDDLGSTQDTTSTPVFTLGEDMQIQIKHYGNDYKINPKPDANYFSLGVLVECNGRSAFLAGDINNYEGAETALTEELGHVDILTLGHHGYYGSNTHGYVTGLSPQIMVCAGKCSGISNDPGAAGSYSTLDTLLMMSEKGTPLYATSWYHKSLDALVFNFDEALSSNIPSSVSWLAVTKNLDFNDHIRYLDGFPSAYSGWADYEEKTYYFDNSCYPSRNCWLPLGQKRYYLDNDGTLKIGWLELDEYWYYMDVDGAMLTDWQRINDRLYYFDSHSGTMQTGWLSVDNERYYLNPENGAAKTGWQFVDDEWYYLTPENGSMKTGWQFINNKWYYLNPDNGSMKTGWQFINNKWYYLNPDNGSMKTGWQFVNNKWYYLTPGNGSMKTGWQFINNKWYYLTPGNGSMKTGWQFINNKWYYLTPGNGSMKTGWQFINNKWYYLTPGNGSMKTGWQKINRKYYYLYSSGAMAADTWIGEYYVNRSGIWIP